MFHIYNVTLLSQNNSCEFTRKSLSIATAFIYLTECLWVAFPVNFQHWIPSLIQALHARLLVANIKLARTVHYLLGKGGYVLVAVTNYQCMVHNGW